VCEPTFRSNLSPPSSGLKISRARNGRAAGGRFLARLIFEREEGGDKLLRNVGSHTDYTASYHRRWKLILRLVRTHKAKHNFTTICISYHWFCIGSFLTILDTDLGFWKRQTNKELRRTLLAKVVVITASPEMSRLYEV
jgi:hypothetical protein